MKIKEIKKYLNYLKFKKFYKPKYKSCELCGSNKSKILRNKISWNNKKFGVLPIHCCTNCGFVFQNPRFSKEFYLNFYKHAYRKITHSSQTPSKSFIRDQKYRGDKLYNFLKSILPKKGSMLDIGCSVGMMMKPFLRNNWKCQGNDPIKSHVDYGKKKYNLPVEWMQSEDMKLKNNSLDLIIIAGSIEHVFDLNLVMKKCKDAIKTNGLIVMEARGNPLGNTKNFFNQSHHRYFFKNTLQLILIKYGFEPFLTTTYPISGPTRKNTIFCLARYKGTRVSKNFDKLISSGKRETFDDVNYKLKYYDYLAKANPGKPLLR